VCPSNFNRVLEGDPKIVTTFQTSLWHQRNVGFGTVFDVAYAANLGRHLGQTRQINTVPYGAQFLPTKSDPTNPSTPLSGQLRPYVGYGNLRRLEFSGTSSHHSQVLERPAVRIGLDICRSHELWRQLRQRHCGI
jgi:hypothetical protein